MTWAMLFIGLIVGTIFVMWGYSSDVSWVGFAHVPLYIGYAIIGCTVLGFIGYVFGGRH